MCVPEQNRLFQVFFACDFGIIGRILLDIYISIGSLLFAVKELATLKRAE
jgi:hypothetical protein